MMLERKFLAHYVDVNMGVGSTNYVRLGKDLEEYIEELTPQVDIQRNLVGSPNVTFGGYEAGSSVDMFYADPDDPLFMVIANIANGRLTDDSCKTTKVDVLIDGSGNQLWAYRESVMLIPQSMGGDTSGVQFPFKMYNAGKRTYGEFDFNTKTFTQRDLPYDPSDEWVEELEVFENGFYSASNGHAYNPVRVNVPAEGMEAFRPFIERTGSEFMDSRVEVIGSHAFEGWNALERVSFPSCSIVGENAFASCYNLSSVVVSNVAELGIYAFRNCSVLQSIDLPLLESVAGYAFLGCRALESVSLPSVKTVGSWAFNGCVSLPSADLPLVEAVDVYAFAGCVSLSQVSLPMCSQILAEAFSTAGLVEISLPLIQDIRVSAFYSCLSLTKVSIKGTISSGVFRGCSNLSTVYYDWGTIYSYAFYGCTSLMSVYFPSGYVRLMESTAFFSTPISKSSYTGAFGSIYVPASLYATYITGTNWILYSNRFVSV